ncbi:YceD family protein [Marinihelvus fidelis]|nr:YceD family protein [Marinihelvus fidelis]
MPLVRMPRLLEMVEDEGGEAEFRLSVSSDIDGRPELDLSVKAGLTLVCQASLKPYVENVERRTVLTVIAEEAEMALLPDSAEPVVVDEGRVALATLVEDELILGLPVVPRNPEFADVNFSSGELPEPEEDSGTRKPFAALGDLVGKQR